MSGRVRLRYSVGNTAMGIGCENTVDITEKADEIGRLTPAGVTEIHEELTGYEMPLDFLHETWYKKSKIE